MKEGVGVRFIYIAGALGEDAEEGSLRSGRGPSARPDALVGRKGAGEFFQALSGLSPMR